MKNKYLEAGRIINTHGVRGEVKLDAWCDDIRQYLKIKKFYLSGNGENELKVEKIRVADRFLLVKFENTDTLDDALRYKNKIIYLDRDDIKIPKGSHFISDLIDTPVYNADDECRIGTLLDITNRGGGDLYEIELLDDRTVFVPAVREFIVKADPDEGIFINVIEGLLD